MKNKELHWAIKLRLALLLPFSCEWNAWVRDWTAQLETGEALRLNTDQPIFTRAWIFGQGKS